MTIERNQTMKPTVELIGIFEKKQDENGNEYHSGTLDTAQFKKSKSEIHLILMKGKLLPEYLRGSDSSTQEHLFMFAQNENQQQLNSGIEKD